MTTGRRHYLVIERFRDGNARPVYERFRAEGRLAPEGLDYVSSWITADLTRCYQVMACADRRRLDAWMAAWADLVDFEVHDVMTSAEAVTAVLPGAAAPAGPPAKPAAQTPAMRMYSDLAEWWPLLSPPVHYGEEAADLLASLREACDGPPTTLLELGSGGGSLAWHLKPHFRLTLTDISPQMLAVNRATNPECEHVLGDMRTLDLGRTFDLVLIHDAIMYATDEASVRATLATAARHCRPGGGLAVLPDCVTETFEPDTFSGGEDHPDGRGLRYLEWSWDPDPHDTTVEVIYALVLRERDGSTRVELDRHTEGCFPRAAWLTWLRDAGFSATVRTDPWDRDVFVGRRLSG